MSSVVCESSKGIKYYGDTIENEFRLASSKTPNVFSEAVEGDLIVDSHCTFNGRQYKITRFNS